MAEALCKAECECCGHTEDCTKGYHDSVCQAHEGRWICGLCAEAVKEERKRLLQGSSSSGPRDEVSWSEALERHMRLCAQFRSSIRSPEENFVDGLIATMRRLFRRTLESAKKEEEDQNLCACRRSRSRRTSKLHCCRPEPPVIQYSQRDFH